VARLTKMPRTVFTSTGKTRVTAKAYAAAGESGDWTIDADPYTSTKIASELLANDYAGHFDLNICIARFNGLIYGPGTALGGLIGQVLLTVLDRLMKGEPVDLRRTRDYGVPQIMPHFRALSARDAAHGVVLVTQADTVPGRAFNIPGREDATLADLGAALLEHFPDAQIEPVAKESGITVNPPDHLSHPKLGYEARYGLWDGIAETVSFLKSGKLLYPD
jgi:nucleoside-diphosphate-sugar epimerase